MPLIIDTFNVLHTGGVLPPDLAAYGDVEGLVRLLGVSRYRNERIELVCDGSPQRPSPRKTRGSGVVSAPEEPVSHEPPPPEVKGSRPANANIRFSGPGREADEVIAMLVRHSTAPRSLTVVSSDAAVQRMARRRKCRTLTSQQFLEHLAMDFAAAGFASPASVLKPPGGLSEPQVEAWMEMFAVDEDEAERLAQHELKRQREKDVAQPGGDERTPHNQQTTLPQEIIEEAERLLRERRAE